MWLRRVSASAVSHLALLDVHRWETTLSEKVGTAKPKKSSARHELMQFIENSDVDGAVEKLVGLDIATRTTDLIAPVLHLCVEKKKYDAADRIIQQFLVRGDASSWQENILSIVLRVHVEQRRLSDAMQCASFLKQKHGALKKRNFSPLLKLLCDERQVALVKGLLAEEAQNVELDGDDLIHLTDAMRAANESPAMLHALLSLVAPYLAEVPQAAADTITAWRETTRPGGVAEATISTDGVCGRCGGNLHGYPFTGVFREKLLRDIDNIVASVRKSGDQRMHVGFQAFKRFVTETSFDVLIDGANVGYYGLSSWYPVAKKRLLEHRQRHFPRRVTQLHPASTWSSGLPFVDVPVSMELIDTAVQALRRRGFQKPLIVLHVRHVEPHNLFPEAQAIVDRWRNEGLLYTTPAGVNDDLCWLYAAIHATSPTDDVRPIAVVGNGEQKKRVLILTNDKMRDHHFRLLSPKPFVTWRDRHQLKFKCERRDNQTHIVLMEPDKFTRCIQNDPSRGAWHVPFTIATSPNAQRESDATGMERTTMEDADDALLCEAHPSSTNACSGWICIS